MCSPDHSSSRLALCIAVPALFILFFGLAWAAYRNKSPYHANNADAVTVQHVSILLYLILVVGSLTAMTASIWIIGNLNSDCTSYDMWPSLTSGSKMILFASCWTYVVVLLCIINLFIKPASLGIMFNSLFSQIAWFTVTALFWLIGTGLVGSAHSLLYVGGVCDGIICSSLVQPLFAFAVIELIAIFTTLIALFGLGCRAVAVEHDV